MEVRCLGFDVWVLWLFFSLVWVFIIVSNTVTSVIFYAIVTKDTELPLLWPLAISIACMQV